MPSASQASRSTAGSGSCLATKPPLAPTGTMTAFLTICALTRPRTSVRKSSRRSDQRRPPRATAPKRRCTPSTRGRVDEDLELRPRAPAGRGPPCGSSLSDEVRLAARRRRRAGSSWCAASPGSTPRKDAQDPVVVEAGHVVERAARSRSTSASLGGRALARRRAGEPAAGRTGPRTARTSSRGDRRRCCDERVLDVVLAEGRAGLPQVLRVGAQDDDLPPGQPGAAAPGALKPSTLGRARPRPRRTRPGTSSRSRRGLAGPDRVAAHAQAEVVDARRARRRRGRARRAARRRPRRPVGDSIGSTSRQRDRRRRRGRA